MYTKIKTFTLKTRIVVDVTNLTNKKLTLNMSNSQCNQGTM